MDAYVIQLIQNKATSDELYSLADISRDRNWNYELPTLTKKGRFTARKPWDTCGEFKDAFFENFPIFKEIDLSNIAVMGGVVFDLLHGLENRVADIDLFIVGTLPGEGTTEEKVIRRAEKLMDDIYNHVVRYVKQQNDEEDNRRRQFGSQYQQKMVLSSNLSFLKVTRNGSVLTFNVPVPSSKVPIQLVLGAPRTVPDLLRQVDLDCTAIAFVEGQKLQFNAMSKFCFENACTVVSNIRSKTFETRLEKYFNWKGVDVVLPQLDLSKIPKRNLKYDVEEVIDLATLAIVYSEIINGGKIITTRLTKIDNEEEDEASAVEEATGSTANWAATAYGSFQCAKDMKPAGIIIHENVIHLIHDLPERFQFYGEGKYLKDALLPIPKLTNRMISNSYETVKGQIEQALRVGMLNVLTLEKYFTVKPASQIIRELLGAPLEALEEKKEVTTPSTAAAISGPLRQSLPTVFDTKYQKFASKYLDDLINEQIVQANVKVTALDEDFKANPEKYNFVSDIPFTQMDSRTWYKNYLKTG